MTGPSLWNEWPQRNLNLGLRKSHLVLFTLHYTGSYEFDSTLISYRGRKKDMMQDSEVPWQRTPQRKCAFSL